MAEYLREETVNTAMMRHNNILDYFKRLISGVVTIAAFSFLLIGSLSLGDNLVSSSCLDSYQRWLLIGCILSLGLSSGFLIIPVMAKLEGVVKSRSKE